MRRRPVEGETDRRRRRRRGRRRRRPPPSPRQDRHRAAAAAVHAALLARGGGNDGAAPLQRLRPGQSLCCTFLGGLGRPARAGRRHTAPARYPRPQLTRMKGQTCGGGGAQRRLRVAGPPSEPRVRRRGLWGLGEPALFIGPKDELEISWFQPQR